MYRSYRMARGFSTPVEIRDSLSGALDIRAVSIKRQQYEWNQCAQNNGGCTHLCLYRGHDYVCACPDRPTEIACKTEPTVFVPRRNDELPTDYADENSDSDSYSKENDEEDDDDLSRDTAAQHDTIILVLSLIMAAFGMIVFVMILCKYFYYNLNFLYIFNFFKFLVLKLSSKKPANRRHTREGSSRSVLTFSNPNYNTDGTPMEPKTNIWKRFKYDKNHVSLMVFNFFIYFFFCGRFKHGSLKISPWLEGHLFRYNIPT